LSEGAGVDAAPAGAGKGLRGTLLTTALAAAAAAASSVVLARTLAPPERGELATILLWPLAIGILGELGVSWAVSYYAARDGSLLGGLWTLSWVVSFGWGTLLAVVSHALLLRSLALSGPARDAFAFTLATVPIALATGLQSFLLLGIGALSAYNAVRTSPILLYTAGVLGIALFGRPAVPAYAAAWVVSQVLAFALATAWLVKARRPRWEWKPGLLRPVAVYGAKTYVSSLSAQMTLRLDQLVMTALGVSAVLGVYVVAVAVASATSPLFTALAIVVTHRLQGRAPQDAGRGVVEYLQLAFLLGAPLSLALAAVTPWLVPAVFGAAYRGAVLPSALLLAAGLFQGANAVLGNGLRAIGLPGRPARAEAAGFALTLGLLALLLPRYGATGAAIASLVAYAAVAGIQTRFLCRAAGLAARDVWDVDLGRLGAAGALFRRR
jgi:O-antigen/teichoic acid export membrane protein